MPRPTHEDPLESQKERVRCQGADCPEKNYKTVVFMLLRASGKLCNYRVTS
jgi:hypothetical protein